MDPKVGQIWTRRSDGKQVKLVQVSDRWVGYRYCGNSSVLAGRFERLADEFLLTFAPPQAPHLCGTATTEPVRSQPAQTSDPTNPKDAIGSHKAPACTVPGTIEAELGLAMLEGALKYGRHNYRAAPVRASVYIDAARRHMKAWFDAGQDIDPDSGLSHLAKAAACLAIIRDAQICSSLVDDRPPPSPLAHIDECNAHAARLIAKYPNPVPPYLANGPKKP